MDKRRIEVSIKCVCGHTRQESFSRRLLKYGRKKFGPKFFHRQVSFYANNDCTNCFSQERFQALGIADHLSKIFTA